MSSRSVTGIPRTHKGFGHTLLASVLKIVLAVCGHNFCGSPLAKVSFAIGGDWSVIATRGTVGTGSMG